MALLPYDLGQALSSIWASLVVLRAVRHFERDLAVASKRDAVGNLAWGAQRKHHQALDDPPCR